MEKMVSGLTQNLQQPSTACLELACLELVERIERVERRLANPCYDAYCKIRVK